MYTLLPVFRKMPGANCAIVGCPACKKRNPGRSFHCLPKNDDEWKKKFLQAIRSTRSDKFNENHVTVCSRHFHDSCFIEHEKKSGRLYRRLKHGSLPTLNMPEKSFSASKKSKRLPPRERKQRNEHLDVSVTFQELLNISATTLPPYWFCQTTASKIDLYRSVNSKITMHIGINAQLECEVRHHEFLFPDTLKISSDIRSFIQSVEKKVLCKGITSQQLCSIASPSERYFVHTYLSMTVPKKFNYEASVRSTSCMGFVLDGKDQCLKCRRIERELKRKINRYRCTPRQLSLKTPLQQVIMEDHDYLGS